MKKQIMMILGVLSVLVLSGCGGSMSMNDTASSSPAAEATSGYGMEKSEKAEISDTADNADYDTAVDGSSNADAVKNAGEQASRKLIVTETLTVETREFDAFYAAVSQNVEALGGYIESSEISGALEYQDRYANFRIRIPADKLGEFVSAVDENGTVVYDSRSTDDVTLQYVDTESHLKALKTEEETLLTLLEQAKKLSDVFDIQERLTEVRYEIESYTSQLRVYDNQVDYSTVNLSVNEVARETSPEQKGFWAEASSRFSDRLYWVGRAFRGFGIWFIGNIPVFAVLAVIIILIVLLIRRQLRKKEKHRKNNDSQHTSDPAGREPKP